MSRKVKLRSGFVFVELAIALPLLIVLMYTLANVGIKIFEQGEDQLADYTLDEEAHYLLERIVQQARAAEAVDAYNSSNSVKFVYRTSDDGSLLTVDNVRETQYYLAHQNNDTLAINLHAKRQRDGTFSNPITGDNSLGLTTLVNLEFRELNPNVLHITLEMKSLVTDRHIKLTTAVYMPACESKSGL